MKLSITLGLSFSIVLIAMMSKVFAVSSMNIRYETPESEVDKATLNWIKALPNEALAINNQSKAHIVDGIVNYINETFTLEYSIALVIGSGRVAYADSRDRVIFVPFTFFEEARQLFLQDGKGDLTGQAVSDAFLHTVLHELGHLLIEMYAIPIVAREEDAADSLATALIIESFTNGAQRVEHIAELYGLEREEIKNLRKWDFIGEHSLNIQRHYQMLCHVYGSAPETYKELKRRVGFSDDRADICIDEYRQISQGWLQLLEPHFQK